MPDRNGKTTLVPCWEPSNPHTGQSIPCSTKSAGRKHCRRRQGRELREGRGLDGVGWEVEGKGKEGSGWGGARLLPPPSVLSLHRPPPEAEAPPPGGSQHMQDREPSRNPCAPRGVRGRGCVPPEATPHRPGPPRVAPRTELTPPGSLGASSYNTHKEWWSSEGSAPRRARPRTPMCAI